MHPLITTSTSTSLLSTILSLILAVAVAADPTYKISNVHFLQYPKSANYINEVFTLGAQGTNPGALVVTCNLSWNASTAAQVPATGPPLVEEFTCGDPAVSVTMQRMTVSPFQPWYLTVSVNNANPVTWNPYSNGTIPYRGGNFTHTNGRRYGEWIFDTDEYTISGAPKVGLPEALRMWNMPNGTSSRFGGWR